MRGENQPMAQARFVSDIVDYKMNLQQALEAPRFNRETSWFVVNRPYLKLPLNPRGIRTAPLPCAARHTRSYLRLLQESRPVEPSARRPSVAGSGDGAAALAPAVEVWPARIPYADASMCGEPQIVGYALALAARRCW